MAKKKKKLAGAALAAYQRKRRRRAAEGMKDMAKKKARKRSSGGKRRRSYSRRRVGGSGLSKRDVYVAVGTAAAVGYLQKLGEQGRASFYTKLPVIAPLGRIGTIAAAAHVLAYAKVAPRWTRPIAWGATAAFALRMGQRGFQLYQGTEGSGLMAGDEEDGAYLAGEVSGDELYADQQ